MFKAVRAASLQQDVNNFSLLIVNKFSAEK
jgi:hypothetical protein